MTQGKFIQILPAYMGCKVTGRKQTGKLLGIDRHGYCDIMTVGGDVHFTNVKLILRTFDQITDEESARFRQLADEADKHSYTLWAMNATKAVNYLRSIGIDCDGLIEAGYAVKQTD